METILIVLLVWFLLGGGARAIFKPAQQEVKMARARKRVEGFSTEICGWQGSARVQFRNKRDLRLNEAE
jgi:hypothetical protein